jgi:carboxyl-terminal processing protease
LQINIMRHLKIKASAVVAAIALPVFFIFASPAANAPAGLSPGPSDGRVAYITARIADEFNYAKQPFDTGISEKFFDGYLETLDPSHEYFLQSDIDGFMRYRTNLDELTIGGERETSDLTPAYEMFQRFLERYRQHAAYVDELLKEDKFKFNSDDHILIDRRHAPYPMDLNEAKQLWREQLRWDYLQEKLGREISPTNADVILPLTKSNLVEIADTLERHDNWILRATTNLDSADVLQTYLEALVHAYDPHSDYLNNEHAQDFSIGMSLSLFGIGAQLGEDDGYCTINSLIPGGPAYKSKQINEKDRIVAVAQSNQPPVDVVGMELNKVVQLIRGPKGTQVRLTISPADDSAARRVVVLTRDEIKLEDEEAKARLIEMPDGRGGTNRLGVIEVPSFYGPVDSPAGAGSAQQSFVSVDVAKLIKKLKQEKVGGIILDMRNDPGGLLEEAVKLTGLFIKGGPVVLARSSDGHVFVDSDTDSSMLYDGPLVVLVNRRSASAAEITAAALQDYDRALIVGDTSTFGKGTVQQVYQLWPFIPSATNDPGEVKITKEKFYRVNGASTQFKGVMSNIVLPDVWNYSTEIGETSLENPLPWDTIPSTTYDKLNLVEPFLPALLQRSDARIATNQDFIYIRQDIAQFKKLQADKTASLNEREEIKQREEASDLKKVRDAERALRPVPNETIYDITVENAGQPGLPAPEPLTSTNEDFSLLWSNANGSVSIMTNNDAIITGIPLNSIGTDAHATASVISKVVTKTQPVDPMLDETENILGDYIELFSSNKNLIANH